MSIRPPEPEFLKEYYEWVKAGPPKCCHTCAFFDFKGRCIEFDVIPGVEDAAQVDQCPSWKMDVPF
jgi:hypothetical protein